MTAILDMSPSCAGKGSNYLQKHRHGKMIQDCKSQMTFCHWTLIISWSVLHQQAGLDEDEEEDDDSDEEDDEEDSEVDLENPGMPAHKRPLFARSQLFCLLSLSKFAKVSAMVSTF